ncbi:MAG: VIT domain-containing protein [Myxococcaceae bacterium]
MRAALLCVVVVFGPAAIAAPREVSPSKVLAATDEKLTTEYGANLPSRGGDPDSDRTLAPYFAAAGTDSALKTLPLKETSTSVHVAGVIAHVRLRQVFVNTGTSPIEAIYVFPASTRAAVHGMRMRIGERTVESRIEKRQVARAQFEAAQKEGRRATLLEQQRPNVFTTRVANLMPKDRIEVELEYSELLTPEDAVYELVVPTVVGPRYGGGADPVADRWIANPYLQEGEKEPYAFDLRVTLETGVPIQEVTSPSHPVKVTWAGSNNATVILDQAGGGNRDFVLRYRLAGDQIEAGVLLWRGEKEGYFAVMLEPPQRPKASEIVPREYIFLLDVSGSMNGFPLDTAKALMRNLLAQLRPSDHFNVVLFAGGAALMQPSSITATPANVQTAIAFVDSQRGGGGTELMQGLERAYGVPKLGVGVARTVVVITDGYVGIEAKAFKFVRDRLGESNLFAFGIGTSVNRGIIEGLARAGYGEPYVVLDPARAQERAERLREAIEQPVLTNIAVRFRGFDAYEVAPTGIPDLMSRRPVVLFGKFRGDPMGGEIEISGHTAGSSYWKTLRVDSRNGQAEALRWLWARKWVELLEDQHHLTQAPEVEEAITDLGLSHRLVTPFTSFVAIDSEVANRSGKFTSVKQPLPLPRGVKNSAVGLLGGLGGMPAQFGPGGMGTGINNALGGLRGGEGLGGLGARGTGPGGGGTGLGLGGLVTRGGGRGTGVYGSVELGGAGKDGRTVKLGKVKTSPGLSDEVVAKVLRRHGNEIRYCYESRLDITPTLSGKLVLVLTIDATGSAKKAEFQKGSSLSDAELQACVMGRARRWRFPAPRDGQEVLVTIPWTFAPPRASAANK